jgi:hypothetical protein
MSLPWGEGCWISGGLASPFKISNFRFQIPDSDFRFLIPNFTFQIPDFRKSSFPVLVVSGKIVVGFKVKLHTEGRKPDTEAWLSELELGATVGGSFNESHILAIAQAICDYRRQQVINGPLFLAKDTRALSEPAFAEAFASAGRVAQANKREES